MKRINRQQFARLVCDEVALLKRLQDKLNVKIVAYSLTRHNQAEGRPGSISLCQVVFAGRLDDEGLRSLRAVEATLGSDVALVAYAKPWRRNCRHRGRPAAIQA